MKKILAIVLVVIIGLSLLSLVRDFLIKSVVSTVATQITGAKVQIGWFSLCLLTQTAKISNFKMYNPAGFPAGIMVDMPKVVVKLDVLALLKGKLHLRLIDLYLKEIGLEKNKEGKLNVDSLKVVEQAQAKPKAKEEPKKPAKQLAIRIDEARLQMGRVVSKDYSVKGEPAISVYNINLKKTYKNINSAQQLVALILSEPMKQAGIKGAAIYGAAMLTGVGIIPVAVVAVFGEKDSIKEEIKVAVDKLYDTSLQVLKQIGTIKKEDKLAGIIQAKVNQADITLKLKKLTAKATEITISARKMMLPKLEIASGILYQITQKLK